MKPSDFQMDLIRPLRRRWLALAGICLSVSLLILDGCIDTAALLAGTQSPSAYSKSKGQILDAQGPMARFSLIWDIAVDSQDNVYVADLYSGPQIYPPTAIRKITPEGVVSTFAGGGDPDLPIPEEAPLNNANLAGMNSLAIRDNILYLSGLNCLRTIDLSQPMEKLSIRTIFGTCLTNKAFQAAGDQIEQAKNFTTLFGNQMIVLKDHTLLVTATSRARGSLTLKLNKDHTSSEWLPVGSDLGFALDSKGNYYLSGARFTPGAPGYLEKWNLTDPRQRIGDGSFFGELLVDTKDNLYVMEGQTLKTGNGRVIGQLNDSECGIDSIRIALNPSETTMFLACQTGVYRLPLPKT